MDQMKNGGRGIAERSSSQWKDLEKTENEHGAFGSCK